MLQRILFFTILTIAAPLATSADHVGAKNSPCGSLLGDPSGEPDVADGSENRYQNTDENSDHEDWIWDVDGIQED
ncbi:MAG TPA: hypothetical protein PKC28_01395 [Bdellovibrionales bacterium]|nr:hypothetical protein [Bdellovibrionales bacterium]